ncbi:MAG: ASCH domain-containing protein [Ruminococcus sp.]|nr:ASCH domain-containing protein [Ruminococcus sp.]
MSAIASVYASLILKGKKTIDDVPETMKEEVESLIPSSDENEE